MPSNITIESTEWLSDIGPDVAFDQNLSSITGIDSSVCVLEVRVVDMTSSESERRHTASDVGEVVVVLGDVEVSSIFIAVVVAVANKRCLVVVVEIGVGDGNPFRGMRDIHQSVIVVLAVLHVGGKVAVVNPDIGRTLDSNAVSIGGKDLLADNVSDNNIRDSSNKESNT